MLALLNFKNLKWKVKWNLLIGYKFDNCCSEEVGQLLVVVEGFLLRLKKQFSINFRTRTVKDSLKDVGVGRY